MDKKVVRELNAYLKGEYMAVKAYEHFIEKMKDPSMKGELQKIQKDHKQHIAKVASRISNLGGEPVKSAGFIGTMSDMKNLFKRSGNNTESIMRDASLGEYRGIQMAEEVVKGDLDDESLKLIKGILEEDRSHVGRLSSLVH